MGSAVPKLIASTHRIMKGILVLFALLAAVAAQEGYGKGYFQYTNVKDHNEYEHGYNRGNPHHQRDHYQQNKDHRFRAKVSWSDKSGGQGEHYFEYNHGPQDGYKEPAPYKAPAPYAPEPAPYAPQYN